MTSLCDGGEIGGAATPSVASISANGRVDQRSVHPQEYSALVVISIDDDPQKRGLVRMALDTRTLSSDAFGKVSHVLELLDSRCVRAGVEERAPRSMSMPQKRPPPPRPWRSRRTVAMGRAGPGRARGRMRRAREAGAQRQGHLRGRLRLHPHHGNCRGCLRRPLSLRRRCLISSNSRGLTTNWPDRR
jgi:hypothetical protein